MLIPEKHVVIANRYALVHALASGGMGAVWLARHLELDALVALKLMAPDHAASAEMRARFKREASLVARVRSQHLVYVQDYGVEDDTPYLVMELLHGEDLGARLRRERRLPLAVAARILLQVCRGLRAAHVAGIVHRDLKPSNIFLAVQDDDEVVKVLDFGIAKDAERGAWSMRTAPGTVLGTRRYMSPEQITDSRSVDHRGDLWSLGVILYRMLAGRLPFPIGSREPVPPASSVQPGIPPWVDAFLARATAPDPDRRFQSATEMAATFSALARSGAAEGSELVCLPAAGASEEAVTASARPQDGGDSQATTLPLPSLPVLSPRDAGERRLARAAWLGGVSAAVVMLVGIAAVVVVCGAGVPP